MLLDSLSLTLFQNQLANLFPAPLLSQCDTPATLPLPSGTHWPLQLLTILFSCSPGLSILPLQSMLQLQARQRSYILGHTLLSVFSFVLCFPQCCHTLHSEYNCPTYWPPHYTHTHTHTHTHTQDSPRLSTGCALFCLNESEVILHSSLHRTADHINPGTSFSHVYQVYMTKNVIRPTLFHLRHQM